jgi:hypothetical protein
LPEGGLLESYAAILIFCLPVQANAWDLQIVNNIDLVEVLE